MAFIIKPLVTEKMTKITDKQPNRYGFIVRPEANKLQIKSEVESQYNVTVEDVNTMRYAGKRSARYTKAGLVKGQKKARNSGSKTQDYWHVRGYYCIRAREVSRLR